MSIKILGTVDKLVTKDERVIQQTGDADGVIASFYDLSGRPSLFLDGTQAHLGNVGIKTAIPNKALTVVGDISATGDIYSNGAIFGASPVDHKTSSFTFALSDVRTVVTVNSVGDAVCSIPATSAVPLPIGSEITIINLGASTVSLNGVANGIDLRSSGAKLRLTAQYSVAFLFKVYANEWIAYGDLKQ